MHRHRSRPPCSSRNRLFSWASSRVEEMEHQSSSPEETERIAATVAAELRQGDVVTVSGELGSGKTTFVRGACRALGVEGPVTSPTFTIGHVLGHAPEIAHLDLYRFEGV